MSTNLLLRRRAMMAANSVSGGGGGEETDGPIILNIVTTHIDENIVEGYLEFSQPCPYLLVVSINYGSSTDEISLTVNSGDTYIDFSNYVTPELGLELLENCLINMLSPYDANYRIIPTHIYARVSNYPNYYINMGAYLYLSNIDYLPVSEDMMGTNYEICPIIKMGPIDNTNGNWIWFIFDRFICFRDTYNFDNYIYALESDGSLWSME